MKSVKRIMALIISLVMVAALVACGAPEETALPEGTPDYLETADKNQTSLFVGLEGTKVRVTVAPNAKAWEFDFIKQFEEETGITVETETMESAELVTKISQAVLSGDRRNYFDVGICASSTILNYIYGNVALPLDKYLYVEDPVWKYAEAADFNCLDLFRIDEHYWVVPSHTSHESLIFYNKTYFEEMQAPDPYTEYYLKDNWTFETFMDTCRKVTKKADDGSVEVAAWANWNYLAWVTCTGNTMIAQNDKNEWEIVFDQPNGMAGLNLLYEGVKNGWLNNRTNGYWEFVNRKVAMLMDKPSSAMGSATNAYKVMADEIGMIPYPKVNKEQEKYICPMNVSGRYLPACAQNHLGAVAYMYYHRIGEQQMIKDEYDRLEVVDFLNKEATERRNEYIAKCEFNNSYVDGLAGWYNENRDSFLKIMWDGATPASAVDQMKPLLKDSLRRTVG